MNTDRYTVAEALRQAQELGLDRLDSQLLLGHVLDQNRTWLITHDDQVLAPGDQAAFRALAERRAHGEPCAYLLGQREFHGLTLAVGPSVLIPRPDTETLVDWALDRLNAIPWTSAPSVADLGTGSGAIALAIRYRFPSAQMVAIDRSVAALEQAKVNAAQLSLPIEFLASNWWSGVDPDRPFHLVVSNPPYIAEDDPHMADLRFEPREALTPGGDGLDAIREIIRTTPSHLHDGGWLLIEHGWDQALAVRALLQQAGWQDIQTRTDLAGRERCTGACWKATSLA